LNAWTIPEIINYNDINKLIQLNKHHNINIIALNKKGEEIRVFAFFMINTQTFFL
jgi:hypothetical protein